MMDKENRWWAKLPGPSSEMTSLHERCMRDDVRCMSVYERLRVLHERSRALVTGLLRVRDWQPAISVWDCHPG